MNSSSSPPKTRAWRIAFPLALLFVGVALSCWMACMSWSMPSESQQVADFSREVESDLRKILPPAAGKGTRSSERLKISSERPAGEFLLEMHIVAVGNFTPEQARAFALVARQPRRTSFARVITVTIYSDANNARTLVASYGVNRTRFIQRALQEKLPSAAPSETGQPFGIGIVPQVEGIVDRYQINAFGPFTPESATTFANDVRALQTTLPGETRLVGTVTSNAKRPYTKLVNFDTATEK